MKYLMKRYHGILKGFWRNHAARLFAGGFFDRIHAKYYYRKKHSWYEKTYWEGMDDDKDYYRPNGILSEGKENIFTKVSIVLEYIDADGNILDLGCGNGLLLKLIQKKSPYPLTPYGVDFLHKSILQAKKLFPLEAENFIEQNIVNYHPGRTFEYILISPGYVRIQDFREFLSHCYSLLSPSGKLIIFSAADTKKHLLARFDILEEFFERHLEIHSKNSIDWICIEKKVS